MKGEERRRKIDPWQPLPTAKHFKKREGERGSSKRKLGGKEDKRREEGEREDRARENREEKKIKGGKRKIHLEP